MRMWNASFLCVFDSVGNKYWKSDFWVWYVAVHGQPFFHGTKLMPSQESDERRYVHTLCVASDSHGKSPKIFGNNSRRNRRAPASGKRQRLREPILRVETIKLGVRNLFTQPFRNANLDNRS
jgi:hypothetical protein